MNRFYGKLCIVRDVTGCTFEGVVQEVEAGYMPQLLVTGCRQINWQDATVEPVRCEAWEVGDQVFNLHHVVGVHLTNLAPR